MRKFLIKLIWELPSNLVAILLMFFLGVDDFTFNKEKSVFIVKMSYRGGLTLGCFVFIHEQDMNVLPHEYGHVKQGWVLGPLYLLVIGIPSLIWVCIYKSLGKPYDSFYTEKWLMEC